MRKKEGKIKGDEDFGGLILGGHRGGEEPGEGEHVKYAMREKTPALGGGGFQYEKQEE